MKAILGKTLDVKMTVARRTIGTAFIALLVGVGAVACGSGTTSVGVSNNPEPSSGPPTQTTSTPTPTSAPTVVSVHLRRSGGFQPSKVSRVFAVHQPPPDGFTQQDVRRVLSAAADLKGVDVNPMPSNTCCDRYSYALVVTWADGSSRTYTTIDGLDQPPAFTRLLHLTI
ncbi:MAG: hypothetical protein ACRDQA_18765 [Nocardioidaceae bacterium]